MEYNFCLKLFAIRRNFFWSYYKCTKRLQIKIFTKWLKIGRRDGPTPIRLFNAHYAGLRRLIRVYNGSHADLWRGGDIKNKDWTFDPVREKLQ